jgi:hypothetical protein
VSKIYLSARREPFGKLFRHAEGAGPIFSQYAFIHIYVIVYRLLINCCLLSVACALKIIFR